MGGETKYKAGEFSQTLGYKNVGLLPSFNGVEVSNDLWGDGGDRFRTSYQKINLGGLSIGAAVFTGDPGLIDKEQRKTDKEPKATSGEYYIKGPYGDPDRYRHGILSLGLGHFKMGGDSEEYRHLFQNIIGHNWISPNSPWFKYIYYYPRPYMQFGGGFW